MNSRQRKKHNKRPTTQCDAPAPTPQREDPRTTEFRERMRSAGRIVREAFGLSVDGSPACTTDDAYRAVIGLIIEALVTGEQHVATSDLVAMSKAVAEQRRLDVADAESQRKNNRETLDDETSQAEGSKAEGPRGKAGNRNGSPRTPPPIVKRVVHHIYGTNLAPGAPGATRPPLDGKDRIADKRA